MAAYIRINKEAIWWVSTGIFEPSLKEIAKRVEVVDARLATRLRIPIDNFPSEDLTSVDSEQFNLIIQAAKEAFNDIIKDPTSYPRFTSAFSTLKALLQADERNKENTNFNVHLSIREETIWVAPIWIGNFLLEQLAISFRNIDEALFQIFIADLTNVDKFVDISSSPKKIICSMILTLDNNIENYTANRIMFAGSSKFYSVVIEHVNKLRKALISDSRSFDCENYDLLSEVWGEL